MPSVLCRIEKDLASEKCVVLQRVSTLEAATTRALAEREADTDLEDLDLTPRQALMGYIERSFPVQQYEAYTDEDGNERMRPVKDSQGNSVLNREAVAARERLLDELASIRVPDGPLDQILGYFGVDAVAEVTGRRQRVVRITEPSGSSQLVRQ